MKKNIIAMLLAGGVGSRLNILARHRAKPAIPFGGIYRIIDFTMSNIANSQIDVVGVLTQYKPLSLMEHIADGRPWDLFGRTRLVEILPPKTGEASSDWYKGTSDAVYQNIGFIEDFAPDSVLVLSGDHIYHMDYNQLITFHKERKSQATVCLIRVPKDDARHFGIARINDQSRITDWEEKPPAPKSDLASMGVYLFDKELLVKNLVRTARAGGSDFARDIMPVLLKIVPVHGFVFDGYWRDVGTIDAYWQTSMDLLRGDSGLDIRAWQVMTNPWVKGEIGDRPASYFSRSARVENSLIARGCIIEGTVSNSIISPGTMIHKQARVMDSIIFHNAVIGTGAEIEKSIIDKDVLVGEQTRIGIGEAVPNKKFPGHLLTGTTVVGKGSRIGSGQTIGKNCLINPGVVLDSKNVASGSNV